MKAPFRMIRIRAEMNVSFPTPLIERIARSASGRSDFTIVSENDDTLVISHPCYETLLGATLTKWNEQPSEFRVKAEAIR